MFFQGRSKNVWESPKGCLLFSFTLQMEDGRIVPHVQYVVCLAMTEAINDFCRKNVSAMKWIVHLVLLVINLKNFSIMPLNKCWL